VQDVLAQLVRDLYRVLHLSICIHVYICVCVNMHMYIYRVVVVRSCERNAVQQGFVGSSGGCKPRVCRGVPLVCCVAAVKASQRTCGSYSVLGWSSSAATRRPFAATGAGGSAAAFGGACGGGEEWRSSINTSASSRHQTHRSRSTAVLLVRAHETYAPSYPCLGIEIELCVPERRGQVGLIRYLVVVGVLFLCTKIYKYR